jgi:ubiquinone/menaquinone biosynthesis C-methylase UbiE
MKLWQHLRRRLEAHPVHTLDPRRGYDRWAHQYDEEENPALYLANGALQKLLPEIVGKRVLDAGCGTGQMIKLIAQGGATQVVGMDFSSNMLRVADQQLKSVRCAKLVDADVLALPFVKESFDAVISSFVMGYIEDCAGAINELARVTRSGGELLLADFHPFGQLLEWNRSFLERHRGKLEEFCIRNYRHLHEDYFHAFKNSGLRMEELHEPGIDASVKHFFDRSRKGREVYEKFFGFPIVLIFKLSKP